MLVVLVFTTGIIYGQAPWDVHGKPISSGMNTSGNLNHIPRSMHDNRLMNRIRERNPLLPDLPFEKTKPLKPQNTSPNQWVMIGDTTLEWEPGLNEWVNSKAVIYLYDDNANLNEEFQEEWNGNTWVNDWKNTYIYDNDGHVTERIEEGWWFDHWYSLYKIINNYDDNGNLIQEIGQWYGSSLSDNDWKETFANDGYGHQLEGIFYSWSDTDWVQSSRFTSTYDGNGRLSSTLSQMWNDSSWVNLSLTSITYNDNGNPTEYLSQFWHGNIWVILDRDTLIYNVNGKEITYIFEEWSGSAWVEADIDNYTYDENGNMIEELSQERLRDNSWLYKTRDHYIWAQVSKTRSLYSLLYNYPNPFNSTTQINYTVLTPSYVNLNIYDILGREVASLVHQQIPTGTYNVEFDAYNLPSGVYFYRLQANNNIIVKKMILMK